MALRKGDKEGTKPERDDVDKEDDRLGYSKGDTIDKGIKDSPAVCVCVSERERERERERENSQSMHNYRFIDSSHSKLHVHKHIPEIIITNYEPFNM